MKVPTLKSELGKTEYYECVLENPTENTVDVEGTVIAGKEGFGVDGKVRIEPFGV